MTTPSALTLGMRQVAAAPAAAVTQALEALAERMGFAHKPASATVLPWDFLHLESEVQRLSLERTVVASENLLLSEIMTSRAREGASRLMRRLVPVPCSGLAALIDFTTAEPAIQSSRGSLVTPEAVAAVVGRQLKQLQSEPFLIHSFETGSPARRTVADLFLIPLLENDTLRAVLATTSLWPDGLRRVDQVDVLKRLGLALVHRCRHERELDEHQQELWLTRQMLHFKSITDGATDQPLQTLGQFASGLSQATGMDRTVLFLESRRGAEVASPVVEAGITLPASLAATWQAQESHFALAVRQKPRAVLYDRSQLAATGIHDLWSQAIACPLFAEGRRLGTLVLSRQGDAPVSSRVRKLVDWSSELFASTLLRIYRDAAIRRQARHDGLTDLANRRTFDALLAGEVDRVRLGLSEECSLVLADLDRFKSINDRYGHQAGDEVLRVTAQLLREQVGRMRVGERSLLARYGGEELAILLPGVGVAGALRIAEEIRKGIESRVIETGDHRLSITASLGVASCPLDGMSADKLVAAADAALYYAKSSGRNCVCRPPAIPGT